jgi:hypothetical protein
MKRIVLLLIGFSLLFSCKKESTVEPSKQIIGKWKVVYLSELVQGNREITEYYTPGSYIEFLEDGVYKSYRDTNPNNTFILNTGTYQVIGDVLTADNDQTNPVSLIFKTKNKLILHEEDGGDERLLERY